MTKQELMRRAIALAVENVKQGGGPFGAVIARNGEIVAEGVNRVTMQHDPTAHAEVSYIFPNYRCWKPKLLKQNARNNVTRVIKSTRWRNFRLTCQLVY